MSDDEFAPPTLTDAASMIRHYGEEHNLSPAEVLSIFTAGLVSQIDSSVRDRQLTNKVRRDEIDFA